LSSEQLNTVHKITTQGKHVVHPYISEQTYDMINIITQKLLLKYELKYDI